MAAKRPQVFAAYEQIIKNQLKTLPTPIQHQNNINRLRTRRLPKAPPQGNCLEELHLVLVLELELDLNLGC